MDRGGFSAALRAAAAAASTASCSSEPDARCRSTRDADRPACSRPPAPTGREVEPAIFGTLLERALDPAERHALGAHYTPRAYVERLVLPTVIEPLRADWADAAGRRPAAGQRGQARRERARSEVARASTTALCARARARPGLRQRQLPLRHAGAPEAAGRRGARTSWTRLGERAGRAGDCEGVRPSTRTSCSASRSTRAPPPSPNWCCGSATCNGTSAPAATSAAAEPVLRDFRNIECRDAVLAYDRVGARARRATATRSRRWDGRTIKPHPVTGERGARRDGAACRCERYVNPRPAEWPQADFIVGNPPFIGNKRMRDALGDGYVEALRAALARRAGIGRLRHVLVAPRRRARARRASCRRFGLITTNSLRQTFNRARRRAPPARQAAAVAGLRHPRPPLGRQRRRRGRAHRDDRRHARRTGRASCCSVVAEAPGGDGRRHRRAACRAGRATSTPI
ncbi:MAG: hypothetical protein MZV65_38850 [Chromatiales bacterium]|nr:hypothetical protein [Chromatiales bacterium]